MPFLGAGSATQGDSTEKPTDLRSHSGASKDNVLVGSEEVKEFWREFRDPQSDALKEQEA